MSVEVEFGEEPVNKTIKYAKIKNFSLDEQIEQWAQIGRFFERELSDIDLQSVFVGKIKISLVENP